MERLQEAIESLNVRLQARDVSQPILARLESRVVALEAEVASIHGRIPPRARLPAVLEEVKQRGAQHGLQFDAILPDYDSLIRSESDTVAAMSRVNVHFRLRGRYQDFGRFLESLKSLPFYVTPVVTSLEFQPKLYPRLRIALDAWFYLRESPVSSPNDRPRGEKR